MWTLVIGFLNLAWWLQDSLKLQHVLVLHFFLSMNNIPLKEESEKVGLNLNIQKTKIMASGPSLHGKQMEKQWKQCQTLF